jgi:hypothetical protein
LRLSLIVVMTPCVLLAGCFPAPVPVQPKAQFLVRDANGHPIENAVVTLATHRMPFPSASERTLSHFRTDAAGKVTLKTKRTWELQVMLPDGSSWYEWIYCIEKPGHRAVFSTSPDFGKPVVAFLEYSEKRSACKWPTDDQMYHEVSVIEE